MNEKILIITSGVTAGGVDSLILNMLSEMEKNRFEIDILIFDDSKDDWAYKFEEYGCTILKALRARKQGVIKSIINYRKIIKNGNYKVIHSHIGLGSVLPVIASSTIKGTQIICHSHFDDYEGSSMNKKLAHLVYNLFPCRKLACSIGAGVELYGKKSEFEFVKNGIDTERFAYNYEVRKKIRSQMGFSSDMFIMGTVGRMEYQKNHEFLLDIFKEVKNKQENSKLILIGDGILRNKILDKARKLNIIEDVIFLGVRNDVDQLLQALDLFVMPTRFEGLSLALLEVQCSGLPCLTTDVVPKEAKVNDEFEFLSLNQTAKEWAAHALKYYQYNRKDRAIEVRNAGFGKYESANEMFRIYQELINI